MIVFIGAIIYSFDVIVRLKSMDSKCFVNDLNGYNLTVYTEYYTADYHGTKINISRNYVPCYIYYRFMIYHEHLNYETISYQIYADLIIMVIVVYIVLTCMIYLLENHTFYKHY